MPAEIPLRTGTLSPDQIRLLLDSLELDLTFVDEHRIVRYYSEGFRIFSRKPEDIGTDVVECHSPAVRPRVARLISELETGWRDRADFMDLHDGKRIRVSYLAMRDPDGTYRGVLEAVRYLDEPDAE
jgi:DUF438 domain-containing protein